MIDHYILKRHFTPLVLWFWQTDLQQGRIGLKDASFCSVNLSPASAGLHWCGPADCWWCRTSSLQEPWIQMLHTDAHQISPDEKSKPPTFTFRGNAVFTNLFSPPSPPPQWTSSLETEEQIWTSWDQRTLCSDWTNTSARLTQLCHTSSSETGSRRMHFLCLTCPPFLWRLNQVEGWENRLPG